MMSVFAPAVSDEITRMCQLMSSTKRRTGFPAKDILHLIIYLLHNLPIYSKELVLLLLASTSAESINESGAILISTVGVPIMVTRSQLKPTNDHCQPIKYVLSGFARRTGSFGPIGRSTITHSQPSKLARSFPLGSLA